MALCEMCGNDTKLVLADIDGAELNVCSSCAKYGEIKRTKTPARFKTFTRTQKNQPEFKITAKFSSLLRNARESKGMKQEDFAKFLNEKESMLHKWEQGLITPSIDTARKLEKILGLRLLEAEKVENYTPEVKKHDGVPTLGDFIKIRKRR